MVKEFYRFLSSKFQSVHLDYKVDMKPRYGWGKKPHKQLEEIIAANKEDYKNILSQINEHSDYFESLALEASGSKDEVNWKNGFFPGLDIVSLHTILASKKPKRYIEVGSGNSTKVAYQSIKRNNLDTQIISIDPFPREEIDQLSDEVIRKPFEEINFWKEINIESGDILFIDNSHRILPNSDAMVFFMEILPTLPKGTIVHIHDIYLPYDYPQFMCDRAYSEQYGLAMFILANPDRYKTIFPNYYVSEDAELSTILDPLWKKVNKPEVERHGGSYWIEIS